MIFNDWHFNRFSCYDAGNVWTWLTTDGVEPALMRIFMNSWYVCIKSFADEAFILEWKMLFNEDTTAFSIWHTSWSPQVLHSSLWVREVMTVVVVYVGKIPCLDFKFILPYGAVMAIRCMLFNLHWPTLKCLHQFSHHLLQESLLHPKGVWANCPLFISPRASISSIFMKWS